MLILEASYKGGVGKSYFEHKCVTILIRAADNTEDGKPWSTGTTSSLSVWSYCL